jgi:hypothetical protein
VRENRYQAYLIKEIRKLLPDCFIVKLDSDYIQGIPDLLVLHMDRWAMLEVKASEDAPFQPNQEYYLALFDGMYFARYICPENEKDVLHELCIALTGSRSTRIPQRE